MSLVEFIESYRKFDDGDYQWNDNHGELIRCKDCKYHTAYHECTNEHWNSTYSPDYPVVDDKDYCSFAERKTDNG